MRKLISLFTVLAFAMVVSSGAFAQPNHDASGQIGDAAGAAGAGFVQGGKKIVNAFVVVGRTVIDGTNFVLLKGAQGIVYVAEDVVYGLKYVANGAKFVIIQTAKGIRWVAIEALKAAEIVFEAALDLTELVVENVEFVLIKLEEGFVFVAKKAIQAGKVVIRGVKYVIKETAEGIIWVTEATWNAIKAGASWARDKFVAAKVRTRLASALIAGGVGPDTMSYFQTLSVNSDASSDLRRLSAAAYNSCAAFNTVYTATK